MFQTVKRGIRSGKWTGWLALVVLATGCGGGSAKPGIVWNVPPLPSAFDDGNANNQTPPEWVLFQDVVRRTLIAPSPIAPTERAALEAAAVALARSRMLGAGYAIANDVQVVGLSTDAYGGIHVNLEQTYNGVPVIGRGAIAHFYPDKPEALTDNLVRGIALRSTTPTVTPPNAVLTATAAYTAATSIAPSTVEERLAILPSFDLVRIGSTRTVDHSVDFEYQLAGATLVYEVTLGPGVEDLDAIAGTIPEAANTDPDTAALRTLRDENATHGGRPSPPRNQEANTTVADEPAIQYIVDANSGVIVAEHSLVYQLEPDDLQNSDTTGYGFYVGKVALDTGYDPGAKRHYLVDRSRPSSGIGNVVYDAKNTKTTKAGNMLFMSDANGSWGDGSIVASEDAPFTATRRQTPAVDVFFSLMRVWDMFDNVLLRDGPEGNGKSLRACVHWDDGYDDAHFNAGSMFMFFGDGKNQTTPGHHSMATVAHEAGHWVWTKAGIGTDTGEAKALNEGNSDIQGALVDLYQNTAGGTGSLIGHFELLANWRGRVVDPWGYSEPIEGTKYAAPGQKYWMSTIGDLPEHVAGLPLARAFVYLAEGAPSDPENTLYTEEFPGGLGGIGITKAARIWIHALTAHLQGTPNYYGMFGAYANAAAELYGFDSMEHKAVRRAFAGIRMGQGAADKEDPEFEWASIYDINVKDMTARAWAVPKDDTGFRYMRASYQSGQGDLRLGFYRGDFFGGYMDISQLPLGQSFVGLEITDSDGKTATTFRSVVKPTNKNLLRNSDFEEAFSSGYWKTTSGESPIGASETRAFIGGRRARMDKDDMLYQKVSVPADAKNVSLVFWLLIRNRTADGDVFEVAVLDAWMAELKVLATYDHLTPRDGRTVLNKGYVRREFDLSAYAGQTIHVAFRNFTEENNFRFHLDHVVLTYESEPYVDVPTVELTPWENTVAFRIPKRGGMEAAEILRVEYWVGGPGINPTLIASSADPTNDYYNGLKIDELPVAPNHWVGALVYGLDNKILAQSPGVWFKPIPGYTQLLVNGGFETGGWNLIYTTGPPSIEVISDNPNVTNAYDGDYALRMGSQGAKSDPGATTGQVVSLPFQVKTLDFSARVKILTLEPGADDKIYLELWSATTFEMISRHLMTTSGADYSTRGNSGALLNYGHIAISLKPGPHAGKKILVLLRVEEDDGLQTTFYVDNASLRYTGFGY